MRFPIPQLADLDTCAERFLTEFPRGAAVGLTGDLGAGKTTFVRAVVARLAARRHRPAPHVRSPSFVLHQSYPELSPPVDHFDLYRLDRADEGALLELGYFEVRERCRGQGGYLFVEWPERAHPEGLLDLEVRLRITGAGEDRTVLW